MIVPTALPPSRWVFDPAAWPGEDCVAVGADLEPSTIVEAYRRGAFPMPHDGMLLWWSPMRRGVLEPGAMKVSRSLRRSARRFEVTVDTAFVQVIDACADPRRPGAWIDSPMRDAYVRLHELGWAHSIETRRRSPCSPSSSVSDRPRSSTCSGRRRTWRRSVSSSGTARSTSPGCPRWSTDRPSTWDDSET